MATRFLVRLWGAKTKQLALLLSLFVATTELRAAELVIQSASARPGEFVEIAIVLNPQEQGVAAVVFEIDYDVSKLQFEPASSGAAADAVAESGGFTIETFDDRAGSGRIGVAVYDPAAPVMPVPAGVIATLRFQVRQDADGFATVVVGGRLRDASDPDGVAVPVAVNGAQSGVAISGRRTRAVRAH